MRSIKKIAEGNQRFAYSVAQVRSISLGLIAWLYRIKWFGKVFFGRNVKLIGASRIQFGRNVVLGDRTWLNVNELGVGGSALEVGDNSFIGQDNFVSVGRTVYIGPYCLTARWVSFVGSSHVYSNPFLPYLKTGVTATAEIYVGTNCFFGVGARVVGNVRVGHGCVVGSGAVVSEDVPPFSLVVGNPARVIKRYDFFLREWVRWPSENYCEGPSEAEYLTGLRRTNPWLIQPISAAIGKGRDIC